MQILNCLAHISKYLCAMALIGVGGCAQVNMAPDPVEAGTDIQAENSLLARYFRTGNYAAVADTRLGRECRIFHPELMDDGRHPVVIWGNGSNTSPASYRSMLEHWASYGMVVAAAMTPNAGTGNEMGDCLDDILDEHTRDGSIFQNKLMPLRVAVAGHSQGGGGAIMLGQDMRVSTVIAIQPYVTGGGHEASAWSAQQGPLLLLSGAEDYTAPPSEQQLPVFEAANVSAYWLTLRGATHLAPMYTGGSYLGPMTAWLRWHLRNDEQAAGLFEGDECGLCSDPRWQIRIK